jgi:hypothetical protein
MNFDELFAVTQDMERILYYRHAILKIRGKWNRADEILEEFNQYKPNDTRGILKDNKNYLDKIKENSR